MLTGYIQILDILFYPIRLRADLPKTSVLPCILISESDQSRSLLSLSGAEGS